MKIKLLFILLFYSAISVNSQVSTNNIELSTKDKILGLSRLWEGVRNNFVYYDQLKFSWDSLYSASIQKIMDTKDSYSYIKEMERIVATLKDGHTYLIHDITPDFENRISPAPFTTRFVDGKVFVDKVWSSDFISKGVKRGVEITAIDSMDVIQYGENILGQYIPSSTRQWLDYKVFSNYELTKGLRTIPVKIEFNNGGKGFTLNIDRGDRPWDIMAKDKSLSIEDYSTLKYTTVKNNIGLLTIRDFMNDSFTHIFDSLYTEIINSKALVIDLRDNAGGRSDYGDYILTHFSSKPIKTCSWSSRLYIPAHASWNEPTEWYTQSFDFLSPVKNKVIYNKPIIILINSGTFSSAEDFLVKFRGMKRGKIVGTTSGGSTGNGIRITLIEGLVEANICSKKDISPDGIPFVGEGVFPDIEIKETKKSFMEGKDIVLEKAISDLSGE